MGQSKEKPKPDASFLVQVDPELLAHSLVTILLKNTGLEPALMQEALKEWRERFMFGGESITLIDVLVQNGNLERYKVPALVKAAEYSLKRREDKLFGKRAFRKGLITQTQLDDALAFQKQLFKALYEVKRLETILVDDGFLLPEDAQEIWSEYESSKEKRRGMARPASLQRAAKSLGIDIGMVGMSQEPTEATGAEDAAAEEEDEASDDFFAALEPGNAGTRGEKGKSDSVQELGTMQDEATSQASAATQPATQIEGSATPEEGASDDPAELLRDYLPQDAIGGGGSAAQAPPSSMANPSESLGQSDGPEYEGSEASDEIDLSDDFEPREHFAEPGTLYKQEDRPNE